MRSSPGVSHRVATPRPQLFPVHRTRAPFGAGRGQQRIFSLRHSSPALSTAIPRVVNTSARLVPSIIHRPASAPVDDPQPACDRAPDTRPPETQRLSLCKGKAEREPAVTGGLVIPEQAKRSLASPVGIRDMAMGSKRAAIRVAWSACRPSCAWRPRTEAHTLRRPTSVGYRRGGSSRGAPGCRSTRLICHSTSSTSRSQYPRHRTPSPAARRPEAATAAWRAAPSGHRLSVRSGYRKRPRATTGSPSRSLPPDVFEWSRRSLGTLWGGLVKSPSKGGDDGRGWRPGTGGVGEGRQRHS